MAYLVKQKKVCFIFYHIVNSVLVCSLQVFEMLVESSVKTFLKERSNKRLTLNIFQIVAGHSYTFLVSVETHLGEVSENKTVTITRKAAQQALLVDLGTDIEDWDPTRDIFLRARVQKSDCVNFDLDGIEVCNSALNVFLCWHQPDLPS